MKKPTIRQSASYKQGFQDGNTGNKSRIDPANNPHVTNAASTEYLTGYAIGKQTFEARAGAK